LTFSAVAVAGMSWKTPIFPAEPTAFWLKLDSFCATATAIEGGTPS
jgi:hypothetical protein